MGNLVLISKESKALISQLCLLIKDKQVQEWHAKPQDKIERATLVAWLSEKIAHEKKSRFMLESLRAAFFKDLYQSFQSQNAPSEQNTKEPSPPKAGWSNKFKFTILAISGTILAICQGYDGIASLFSLFATPPAILILIAGTAFSILSVAVFYGFGLIEISRNLGVSWGRSSHLLDVLLDQVEQINKLKKAIDDSYSQTADIEELHALKKMVSMLMDHYNDLDDAREAYTKALNKPFMRFVKWVISAMSGVLFFSGGYCSAQTVAFAIAGAAASATFWPVILASIAVGIAALGIYWYVERPGLENLVGRWFGLDKDKIDTLVCEENVLEQKKDLNKLDSKLTTQIETRCHMLALKEEIVALHKQIAVLTPPSLKPLVTKSASVVKPDAYTGIPQQHAFFKKSPTQGAVVLPASEPVGVVMNGYQH